MEEGDGRELEEEVAQVAVRLGEYGPEPVEHVAPADAGVAGEEQTVDLGELVRKLTFEGGRAAVGNEGGGADDEPRVELLGEVDAGRHGEEVADDDVGVPGGLADFDPLSPSASLPIDHAHWVVQVVTVA